MYLCVRGSEFASFFDFSIGFGSILKVIFFLQRISMWREEGCLMRIVVSNTYMSNMAGVSSEAGTAYTSRAPGFITDF
jgi:hypothetical protein